jgi:hypothetical protein
MRDPLSFSGIRWPAARVVARKQVVDSDLNQSARKVPLVDTLIIETSGRGRPYEVNFAEGWWRDFAELALDDERRVLSFLQRRGDPFGVLAPGGQQISTHPWQPLKAVLAQAAVAWEEQPDAGGVSSFRLEKLRAAEHMFDMAPGSPSTGWSTLKGVVDMAATGSPWTGWASELGVHYSGVTPCLHAKTLRAYLCGAAAASVRAGLPMRRCDYCSSWFTVHYATARQCSASCRAARFNDRRSPHGFVP